MGNLTNWKLVFGCAIALLGSASAFGNPDILLPNKVVIEPSDLFLPTGFDGNDTAQAVVAGDLMDTCLKAGELVANVDRAKRKIYLRQVALQYVGCWCTKIPVPYFQSVDLGLLPAGEYRVVVEGPNGSSQLSGLLPISSAKTSAPDDHIYAPVEEAAIDTKGDKPVLTLRGRFPSRCMAMQEIRVVQNAHNVVEVLPITDLHEGKSCEPDPVDFEAQVELPARSGKTLVHIRALNGQALNKVMSLP